MGKFFNRFVDTSGPQLMGTYGSLSQGNTFRQHPTGYECKVISTRTLSGNRVAITYTLTAGDGGQDTITRPASEGYY